MTSGKRIRKSSTSKKAGATAPGKGMGLLANPEEALDFLTGVCRKRRSLSGFEIYLEQESRLTIEAREGEVESLVSAQVMGSAVRVISSGRMGFSYTNDFSAASLRDMVARAIESAGHMPDRGEEVFVDPPDGGWPELDIMDSSLPGIEQADKVLRAMRIESSALAVDPRVRRVRGAEYEEVLNRVWIRNSRGVDARAGTTLVSGAAEVVAESGGEAQAASELETVHHYDKLDVAGVGESAARQAVDLLGARSMAARRCPMVLSREAAAGIISVLAPAACGDAIFKQRSWLIGRQHKRIASPAVTIVDDGLIAPGAGAFPFDDEGTASRRIEVVRKGKLENFLYDSYYGKMAGPGSTANGLRPAYFIPPAIDASNWVLLPGKYTEADLLAQVEEGLYIVELMGLHTADPVSGEFSLGASGFRIKKGRRAEPVSGITIAGTLEEMLTKVEAVADDIKFMGDTGSPALLLGEIDVSGFEQERGGNGS